MSRALFVAMVVGTFGCGGTTTPGPVSDDAVVVDVGDVAVDVLADSSNETAVDLSVPEVVTDTSHDSTDTADLLLDSVSDVPAVDVPGDALAETVGPWPCTGDSDCPDGEFCPNTPGSSLCCPPGMECAQAYPCQCTLASGRCWTDVDCGADAACQGAVSSCPPGIGCVIRAGTCVAVGPVEPSPDVPLQDTSADTGPVCGNQVSGSCSDADLSCSCCPAGGASAMENCICSMPCTADDDCPDASRPKCKQVAPGQTGFCAPALFGCCWTCA